MGGGYVCMCARMHISAYMAHQGHVVALSASRLSVAYRAQVEARRQGRTLQPEHTVQTFRAIVSSLPRRLVRPSLTIRVAPGNAGASPGASPTLTLGPVSVPERSPCLKSSNIGRFGPGSDDFGPFSAQLWAEMSAKLGPPVLPMSAKLGQRSEGGHPSKLQLANSSLAHHSISTRSCPARSKGGNCLPESAEPPHKAPNTTCRAIRTWTSAPSDLTTRWHRGLHATCKLHGPSVAAHTAAGGGPRGSLGSRETAVRVGGGVRGRPGGRQNSPDVVHIWPGIVRNWQDFDQIWPESGQI